MKNYENSNEKIIDEMSTKETYNIKGKRKCQQIWNWKIKEKTTTSNCMRKRKKTSPVVRIGS